MGMKINVLIHVVVIVTCHVDQPFQGWKIPLKSTLEQQNKYAYMQPKAFNSISIVYSLHEKNHNFFFYDFGCPNQYFFYFYNSGCPDQFKRSSTNLKRKRNTLLATCTAIIAKLVLDKWP